ncbi:hypothetical protein V8E53_011059 [Lactarius tabidus]
MPDFLARTAPFPPTVYSHTGPMSGLQVPHRPFRVTPETKVVYSIISLSGKQLTALKFAHLPFHTPFLSPFNHLMDSSIVRRSSTFLDFQSQSSNIWFAFEDLGANLVTTATNTFQMTTGVHFLVAGRTSVRQSRTLNSVVPETRVSPLELPLPFPSVVVPFEYLILASLSVSLTSLYSSMLPVNFRRPGPVSSPHGPHSFFFSTPHTPLCDPRRLAALLLPVQICDLFLCMLLFPLFHSAPVAAFLPDPVRYNLMTFTQYLQLAGTDPIASSSAYPP